VQPAPRSAKGPAARFALLGSGEFEPWTAEVERDLLAAATGDGSVLILPAASAPEGDEVFDRWARLGTDHYRAAGIASAVLSLKTRADADREDLAAPVERASAVFFSGGNPAYLVGVLTGTRFWRAVLAGLDRGMAYAGCSAGIASLGASALDSAIRDPSADGLWRPGLELFPNLWLSPHWDALDRVAAGLRDFIVASVTPGDRLLAIDERTALVGRDGDWSVRGAGRVALRAEDGTWRTFAAGDTVPARLGTP
jgi:cyanophycinase